MKLIKQGKKGLALQGNLPLFLHFLDNYRSGIGQEIEHRLPGFHEPSLDLVPKQGAFGLAQVGLELEDLLGR